MKKILRGRLARNARAKKLAQRRRENYDDIATNTRKRRRLARRFMAEEPLFAFDRLSKLLDTNYDFNSFLRDSRPTAGKRKRSKQNFTNRMEFHNELLLKLDLNGDNRIVTRLMLNWENIKKPMVMKFKVSDFEEIIYKCPKNWPLNYLRKIYAQMSALNTHEEREELWKKVTSFGS